MDANENNTNAWVYVADQAANAIFLISPALKKVSMHILLGHQAGIFGAPAEPPTSPATYSRRLAWFFFSLGHLVLKLPTYTEMLSSAVRRANSAKTTKK